MSAYFNKRDDAPSVLIIALINLLQLKILLRRIMKDILDLSTRPKNDDTKRIKKLVRDAWTVPEEVVIMVSELR